MSRPRLLPHKKAHRNDLVAVPVGTGTFWQGMIGYVAGADLDSVLINIETVYGPRSP